MPFATTLVYPPTAQAVQLVHIDTLGEADRTLVATALKSRQNSQSPYSSFQCGAAVRGTNGLVYGGCNIERCSYSQSTHSEQSAVDALIAANGPIGIESLAVFGAPKGTICKFVRAEQMGEFDPITLIQATVKPCGHCRQIIWENCLGNADVRIMCVCPNGLIMVTTIGTLFPMSFGPADLGIDYARTT